MTMVSRLVKFTAKPQQRDDLVRQLLEIADSMRATPGCRMYVINQPAESADSIWVTELWASEEALDASLKSLQTDAGQARLGTVMGLCAEPPERIDLLPLGGVGLEN
jgi:quinol monooxygenase YgiN